MNEDGFKQHFGKYPITDTRLFANRRIGYVGYKTSEDAAKAVKYFNRTFIRMSKIAVELARPVCLFSNRDINLPPTNCVRRLEKRQLGNNINNNTIPMARLLLPLLPMLRQSPPKLPTH